MYYMSESLRCNSFTTKVNVSSLLFSSGSILELRGTYSTITIGNNLT